MLPLCSWVLAHCGISLEASGLWQRMVTSYKQQTRLAFSFQPLEAAQEIKRLRQYIRDPASEQPTRPVAHSLGGLWIWLPWQGTCQIESVDGDAIKQGGGKLGIFAFFPKTWRVPPLSLCFLALWTSSLLNC